MYGGKTVQKVILPKFLTQCIARNIKVLLMLGKTAQKCDLLEILVQINKKNLSAFDVCKYCPKFCSVK